MGPKRLARSLVKLICLYSSLSEEMSDIMDKHGLSPGDISSIRENPIFHILVEELTLDDIKHFSPCGAHIRDETTKHMPTHVLDAADVLKIALRSQKIVNANFVEDYEDIFK